MSGGTTLLQRGRRAGPALGHAGHHRPQAGRGGAHGEREPVPHPDRVDPRRRLPGRRDRATSPTSTPSGPRSRAWLGRADDLRRGHGAGAPRRLRPGGQGPARLLDEGGVYRDQYRIIDSLRVRALDPQPGRGRPLDDNGAITGIIGSVEDVTELVVAQEQNSRLAEIVETHERPRQHDRRPDRQARLPEPFGPGDVRLRRPRHPPRARRVALHRPRACRSTRRDPARAPAQGETWTGELPMFDADGSEILGVAGRSPRPCGPTAASTSSRRWAAT